MNTLYTVFPYGNTVVLVTITGEQLLEVLEASTFSTPTAIGGFPQIAGGEQRALQEQRVLPQLRL